MNTDINKSCENCKFFATHDTGYSNYTVTDTEIICLKGVFEAVEESNIRGHGHYPERLKSFALHKGINCENFVQLPIGISQVNLDVDGEVTIEDFKADNEIYQAAKQYFED